MCVAYWPQHGSVWILSVVQWTLLSLYNVQRWRRRDVCCLSTLMLYINIQTQPQTLQSAVICMTHSLLLLTYMNSITMSISDPLTSKCDPYLPVYLPVAKSVAHPITRSTSHLCQSLSSCRKRTINVWYTKLLCSLPSQNNPPHLLFCQSSSMHR